MVEEEIRKRPDEGHDSRPVPGLQPAVAALPTKGLIMNNRRLPSLFKFCPSFKLNITRASAPYRTNAINVPTLSTTYNHAYEIDEWLLHRYVAA